MRRIGKALEGRVEKEGRPNQHNRKRHHSHCCPEQHLREGLELIFGFGLDLRRCTAGDEDDAPRRFLRVRIHAGDEILRVSHG
ncbi:MAG: hypothetical protein DMG99_09600 [Acidobacteria bacterium]|nr:MAG: hypothetical protein DMG99_09600 [Acidobacteriota bacterium]